MTPRLVKATYNTLLKKAESGNLTFHEGVQFLEKTGYLHTAQDKEEQNRKKAALVEQLLGELTELKEETD